MRRHTRPSARVGESAWKAEIANHYFTKAVRNKNDHSGFISDNTDSGKRNTTKKQTNTLCLPEASTPTNVLLGETCFPTILQAFLQPCPPHTRDPNIWSSHWKKGWASGITQTSAWADKRPQLLCQAAGRMFPFTKTVANSRHNLARNKKGSLRIPSLSHFKISMLPPSLQ